MCLAAAGSRRIASANAANTLLRERGVSDAVIQQLAGHATVSMTDHYTGVLTAAMHAAVDDLSADIQPVLGSAAGHQRLFGTFKNFKAP